MMQRELAFRKELMQAMGGRWLVAIHVENRLNPGVPDLSYVMVAPGHETGWLELKAPIRSSIDGLLKLKIEPSQHQWMIRYAARVPSHFLIRVVGNYYLISGTKHQELAKPMTEDGLRRLAIMSADSSDLSAKLTTVLQGLTRRDRNGSETVVW